ncbi:MAG TPA: YceI family protein [Candidatus Dormibacteraeota bacterium]|jgi:polyisoprenoid-binding protein YceI
MAITLGPGDGSIKVYTKREGMAARVGHDLTLEPTSWSAEVNLDPDDITRSSVTATVDGHSLEVVEGHGGATPLSDKDRADIKKNIAQKILPNGSISFTSTSIESSGDGRFTVSGDLTINGTTRPVRIELGQDGDRVSGRLSLRQTDFGIKPFSAMLGALKVADAIEVAVEARLPTG